MAGDKLPDRSMVLEGIHCAKVIIFLMGWIHRVGEYLGIKAAAIIEVLAFPSGLTNNKLWKKLFAIFLNKVDNSVSIQIILFQKYLSSWKYFAYR